VTVLRPGRGEHASLTLAGHEDYFNTLDESYKAYLNAFLARAAFTPLPVVITCGANADYFRVLLRGDGGIEPSVSLTVGRLGLAEEYVSLALCQGCIVGELAQEGGLTPPTPGAEKTSESVDRRIVHANLPFNASERIAEGHRRRPARGVRAAYGLRQSTGAANGMSSSMSPPVRGIYPPPLLSGWAAPRSALFGLVSIVISPLKRASTISVE
jgi:hypothetical protein